MEPDGKTSLDALGPAAKGGDDAFTYRFETREGYVCCFQTGAFQSERELRDYQTAIVAALRAAGTYRMLFDTRNRCATSARVKSCSLM